MVAPPQPKRAKPGECHSTLDHYHGWCGNLGFSESTAYYEELNEFRCVSAMVSISELAWYLQTLTATCYSENGDVGQIVELWA